jgi:hypothetical protein
VKHTACGPTNIKSSSDSCVPTAQAKGRRDGNGFLKGSALISFRGPHSAFRAGMDEGIQDQSVADEELVLELLHNRSPGSRPAPPVNVPARIAWPIIAQRHELLRLADGRCQRHAAALI